jgi:hypothetical protein
MHAVCRLVFSCGDKTEWTGVDLVRVQALYLEIALTKCMCMHVARTRLGSCTSRPHFSECVRQYQITKREIPQVHTVLCWHLYRSVTGCRKSVTGCMENEKKSAYFFTRKTGMLNTQPCRSNNQLGFWKCVPIWGLGDCRMDMTYRIKSKTWRMV